MRVSPHPPAFCTEIMLRGVSRCSELPGRRLRGVRPWHMSHEEWLLGLERCSRKMKWDRRPPLLTPEVTAHVKKPALVLCNLRAPLGSLSHASKVDRVPAVGWHWSGSLGQCPEYRQMPLSFWSLRSTGPRGEVVGDGHLSWCGTWRDLCCRRYPSPRAEDHQGH